MRNARPNEIHQANPANTAHAAANPTHRMTAIALALLAMLATLTATNAAVPAIRERSVSNSTAVVDQPRLTGYFVGDLFTQSVLLQRDGNTLTPVVLPATGRVSAWFERRHVAIVTDATLRHWLTIEYQILNAPPKLIDAKLPAWRLRVTSNAGGPPLTLEIPAVAINIAPLSPPGSPEQVGTRDLRPDHLPQPIPLAPIRRALAVTSTALALTLIAWLAWTLWRNTRATATQPFARALREIRGLDDREPRTWQALHRAFDRTAGHVIQSATLPTLFERAPQLSPARTQIEDFFSQSSLLFFGSPTAATRATAPIASNPASTAPTAAPANRAAVAPSPAAAARNSVVAPSPDATARNSAVAPTPNAPARNSATAASNPTSYLPRTLCAELRRIERRHER